MDFEESEPGAQGAFGGGAESVHDRGNLARGQFMRGKVARFPGNGAGTDDGPAASFGTQGATIFPRPAVRRLATGVRQLQSSNRTLGVHKSGDARERLF